jgi:hypothetical protein
VKKIRKPDKLYATSDIFTKKKRHDKIYPLPIGESNRSLESYLDNRRYLT